jgi:hypothetical protein
MPFTATPMTSADRDGDRRYDPARVVVDRAGEVHRVHAGEVHCGHAQAGEQATGDDADGFDSVAVGHDEQARADREDGEDCAQRRDADVVADRQADHAEAEHRHEVHGPDAGAADGDGRQGEPPDPPAGAGCGAQPYCAGESE